MQGLLANLPANSPARSLVGLARQIALPHEHAPLRYPSFPALERTALMGFSQVGTWAISTGTSDQNKFMLARQAAFPFWTSPSVSGTTYIVGYNAYSQVNYAELVSAPEVSPSLGYYYTGGTVASTFAPGIAGGTPTTCGYPILGVDSSVTMPYVYVPENSNCYLVVGQQTAVVNACAARVSMACWTAPGEENYTTYATCSILAGNQSAMNFIGGLAGGKGTWVRPIGIEIAGTIAEIRGAWNITFVVVSGTAVHAPSVSTQGTVTVTPAANFILQPAFGPSEYANSIIPWQSTRTTAAAVCLTNVTQVLNKGGTVLAARVNPANINPFSNLASPSYVSTLHPAEKSFLALETGMYTYAPPSTDLAEFWDYTGSTLTTPPPVYRLDNSSMVTLGFLQNAVVETMAFNMDWHIEFRTSSALFPIGISTMTLESLHYAQLALHEAGFFFENPSHKGILSKVVDAAAKYAKVAAPVLSVVHPGAGAVARVVGSMRDKQVSAKPRPMVKQSTKLAVATGGRKEAKGQHKKRK